MRVWPRQQRPGLLARETAWKLEQLCFWGISLRVAGRCAGEFITLPKNHPHVHGGHDSGCFALGVPLSLAKTKLAHWDGVGALRFLSEAFSECVAELTADARQTGYWQERAARDSITHAIRRRITPMAPSQANRSSTQTADTEKNRQRGPRLKLQPRPPPSDRISRELDISTRGFLQSHRPLGAASPG